MPSTTPNSNNSSSIQDFIEELCGPGLLRVEKDLGHGYVKLRIDEAEKRQAAQDIRSNEDILIELLRNSRDSQATQIFVATSTEGTCRTFVIIDDGNGIPQDLHKLIFEPRVTSKLDSAHLDRWGMHGRGMALYSISVHSDEAYVVNSREALGASLRIVTSKDNISEKKDQSTFPRFEITKGIHAMRGPRNILRTAAEFALEERNLLSLYCGSTTEIAATIYQVGCSSLSKTERTFNSITPDTPLVYRLAYCSTPRQFKDCAQSLGLDLSERSARRILDGEIEVLPSILERISQESFSRKSPPKNEKRKGSLAHMVTLSQTDKDNLSLEVARIASPLLGAYYQRGETPRISVRNNEIHIVIPVIDME